MKESQKIIIITVENKSGVLNRVVSLLRRRNFNIDSLTVAKTIDENYSRMTIRLESGVDSVQVTKHLHKLINVIKVWDYNDDEIILHESLFIKVNATRQSRAEVLQLADIFKCQVVGLTEKSITFQYSNSPEKIEEFIETMIPFGIKEIVRSGAIAIAKDKK